MDDRTLAEAVVEILVLIVVVVVAIVVVIVAAAIPEATVGVDVEAAAGDSDHTRGTTGKVKRRRATQVAVLIVLRFISHRVDLLMVLVLGCMTLEFKIVGPRLFAVMVRHRGTLRGERHPRNSMHVFSINLVACCLL